MNGMIRCTRTHQAPKRLKYFVRCTVGFVEEKFCEQHVICTAVAHLFFGGLWEWVIIFSVIKFMFMSAIKLHPRSSRMVRSLCCDITRHYLIRWRDYLLGNFLPECNHIELALGSARKG